METTVIAPKSNAGRPTIYEPRFCKIAAKLCSQGAINQDLADAFGVAIITIYDWKKRFPEFASAIDSAKDEKDSHVERCLFERATGILVEGKDGVYSVPPEITAIKFWLINRRREQWRDVQRIEHTGKDGENLFPSLADLKMELAKRGAVEANGRILLQDGGQKIIDVESEPPKSAEGQDKQ
ncbi:MAG: hypothetical protein KGL39_31260 [Patescibacteria group bacterium]|nr:hypothetical protein [Patescibacteria group bacterium]